MNSKKYSFINLKNYSHKKYEIRVVRKNDIQKIKKWRNEQIKILRQNKQITTSEQNDYYENFIKKSFFTKKPKMIIFSFLLSNKCIGYGGFTHINWTNNKAELSFILDTKRVKNSKIYRNEFNIFLKLILKLNNEQIRFKKIFSETYDIRPIHMKILENMNFRYKERKKKIMKIDGKMFDSLIHEYKLE